MKKKNKTLKKAVSTIPTETPNEIQEKVNKKNKKIALTQPSGQNRRKSSM